MSSQGSQGNSRWGVHAYSFNPPLVKQDSATSQSSHYLPMRSMNNMPSLGHVSSSTTNNNGNSTQLSSGLWAPTSLPNTSAHSHPRIVPNSSSNMSYSALLVSYPGYGMDGLMLSPPLGSTSMPVTKSAPLSTSELDPYQVPPLSHVPSSNSSNESRPQSGGSPSGRRGSTNQRAQSPAKKRKSGEGKLPTFLVRLYELLKEPKYPDLLNWDETGQFIVAHTAHPRLLEVLKSEYNQNRVASFTRQLNIYGWMRDNITRNTESTEPTLWRHDSLNRESTIDDLLTTVRRVAPRTSQAEKRRKMEEEEGFSPLHRSSLSSMSANPWPIPVGPAGGFSLGSTPVDNSGMGHRRQRSRRFSYPQGGLDDFDAIPRPMQDALQLHSPSQIQSPTEGGMMSYSAPSTNTANQFYPLPNHTRAAARVLPDAPLEVSGILGNPGVGWMTGQEGFLLQNGGSTSGPQYQVNNPTSWARHGISTLGNGLKPFQPAPLDNSSPEASIQQLTNGLQAFNMPQNTLNAPGPAAMSSVHTQAANSPPTSPLVRAPIPSPPPEVALAGAAPTYHDSPEEPVILTPPPPAPQPLRQHVVPGSYMGPNMTRPAPPWTPRLNHPTTSVTRAEVLAPRSSSVLQRVMHGQSGLSFVAEEEGDPLPSASLPQPRLFDDFEEPKV